MLSRNQFATLLFTQVAAAAALADSVPHANTYSIYNQPLTALNLETTFVKEDIGKLDFVSGSYQNGEKVSKIDDQLPVCTLSLKAAGAQEPVASTENVFSLSHVLGNQHLDADEVGRQTNSVTILSLDGIYGAGNITCMKTTAGNFSPVTLNDLTTSLGGVIQMKHLSIDRQITSDSYFRPATDHYILTPMEIVGFTQAGSHFQTQIASPKVTFSDFVKGSVVASVQAGHSLDLQHLAEGLPYAMIVLPEITLNDVGINESTQFKEITYAEISIENDRDSGSESMLTIMGINKSDHKQGISYVTHTTLPPAYEDIRAITGIGPTFGQSTQ